MGTKLKQAPVYFAIGQVQYNPLLNIPSYVPEIQERLRKAEYADFKQGTMVLFDIGPVVTPGETPKPPQPVAHKVERFTFANARRTSAFLLQTNSLSFETTEYDAFTAFMSQLNVGVGIVADVVGGLSFTERLGLRYLNAVAAPAGETLQQYLATELLGLPSRMPEANFLYSFAETLMFREGVGQVVSRTIVQNGKLAFPPDLQLDVPKVLGRFEAIVGEHAVIDIDGSFGEREPFNMQSIESRLTAIHDEVEKCFHASVTDHARMAWDA